MEEVNLLIEGLTLKIFPFILIGIIVSIMVSIAVESVKHITGFDTTRFSPLYGLVFSTVIVFGRGDGFLTAIGIFYHQPIPEVVHYVDLVVTSFIGLSGAVGYHKLVEGVKEYMTKKGDKVND